MTSTESSVIQNIDDMEDPGQSTYQPTATKRPGIPPWLKNNAVLVAMTAVSIGVIGFLAVNSRPQAASASQTRSSMEIVATIAMLEGPPRATDAKAGEIAQIFYCDVKRRQIPFAALSGNPFVFNAPELPEESTGQPDTTNGTARRRSSVKESARVALLMQAVRKFTLDSVLVGPNGQVAIISGNLVAKGQKIGKWTVSEIRATEVVLTWHNRKYALKLAE